MTRAWKACPIERRHFCRNSRLRSKTILWFGFTTVHSIDQSMQPTMEFRRVMMSSIQFDSKLHSALWHHAMRA